MLKSKKFKMDEQLLDTLISFSDFQNFKEMMLNYKHSKNNKNDILVMGLNVQKVPKDKNGKNFDNFDFLNQQFNKKNPPKNAPKKKYFIFCY